MARETVTYYSEGHVIAADLFTPDAMRDGETHPVVIICHGFAGIRDIPTWHELGQEFVKRGYVALTFDYRGFGHSGGERGRLAPLEQVDDTRNTITFVETLPFVDRERIGLFGVSYGCLIAPHVAAVDTRVKAALGLWGVATGYQALSGTHSAEEMNEWKRRVEGAQRQRVLFNEIDRSIDVRDVFRDPTSQQFLPMLWDFSERYRNKIGFDCIGRIMEHRPVDLVHQIAPRALGLFCAVDDTVADPKSLRELFDAAREPKKWVEFPGGHYDKYEGAAFQNLMNESAAFFDEYMKMERRTGVKSKRH